MNNRNQITQPLSFVKLFPNIITILGLTIGVSSIRFALDGKWEQAVTCILIAAIIDGIDGKVARLLKATSIFGAELDSLSDFVNFGVSPAMLIYLWSFAQYEYKLVAWGAVLVFIVCMAIRLARFNTSINVGNMTNMPYNTKFFFTGVPAPSGALLAVVPIMVDFDLTTILHFQIRSYILPTVLYLIFIGFLVASRVPTVSIKNISIKPQYVWMSLCVSAFAIIALWIYPWFILPVLALIYLLSLPISILISKRIN